MYLKNCISPVNSFLIAIIKVIILIVLIFSITTCNTSNGNSEISLKGKRINGSLSYKNNERIYRLYIPSSYSKKEGLPLVVALHGTETNIDKIERRTGLSNKAEEEGFILVYPGGSGQFRDLLLTWNARFCCGYAVENNIDDVGFINSLIDEIILNFNIDTKQVYIIGFSNGGMLAYRIASELSEKINGVAVVSGAMGGKTFESSLTYKIPKPKKEIPLIIFHGRKDEIVPYDGGTTESSKTINTGAYSYLSVEEAVSFWISNNECSIEPETSTIKEGKVTVDFYSKCKNNSNVVLYTLNEGGHSWPGGVKIGEDGSIVEYISATDIIWEFFSD